MGEQAEHFYAVFKALFPYFGLYLRAQRSVAYHPQLGVRVFFRYFFISLDCVFQSLFFSKYSIGQYNGLFGCVVCSEGDFFEIYAQVLYDYPVGRAPKCNEFFAHEGSFDQEEIAFGKESFVSFLPFFLPG